MSVTDIVLLITELIGTVAFSVSGSLTAIDRGLDAFGVLFIGCITATGGGILRDLLIGHVPPAIFSSLFVLGSAALTSFAVFVIAYCKRRTYHTLRDHIEAVNSIFDAVGLAAFSVMGTEGAIASGHGENVVLSVCIGMLTGVGGGILRDILTDSTPYVLKKHIYALASIAGSLIYYFGSRAGGGVGTAPVTFAAMAAVIAIRLLAAHFRWSLPRVKLDTDRRL